VTARARGLVLAVVAGLSGACDSASPDAAPQPDASASSDAEVDAQLTFTPVRFDGHYYAHSVLRNRCDRFTHMVGSEPVEPGRYPVAIFVVGTSGVHDGPGIVDHVLPALAQQGFVAASLDYENETLFGAAQNCNLYRDNASCMIRNDADHVAGERRSAIAQLCARPKADCSKGVVLFGHSQGGMTAIQAFQFDPVQPPIGEPLPRLVAVAPMGVGPLGYIAGIRMIDVRECMTADTIAVAPTRLMVVNGETDRYFNGPDGDQAGGQIALETVTGRICAAPSWDCRDAAGDGYVLVKPSELSHGRAAHDYMHDFNASPVVAFGEPNWISPANLAPWGLYATARWLKAHTGP